MFTHQTVLIRQCKRFTVTITDEGWAVREEEDSRVLRAVTYTDWHRVERAQQMFEREGDSYDKSASTKG